MCPQGTHHWPLGNPVGNGDPNVDGGWEPRGQPPQPPAPPQPDEDIGCLINTLATRLQLGTLCINTFSCEAIPGKTEVSFEQWYHEVQCVKDHYPELLVQESIVKSLKGAVADMARYMDPTTSVAHILQKLTVIFSTVASFDVLIQMFIRLSRVTTRRFPPLP